MINEWKKLARDENDKLVEETSKIGKMINKWKKLAKQRQKGKWVEETSMILKKTIAKREDKTLLGFLQIRWNFEILKTIKFAIKNRPKKMQKKY